MNEIMQRRGGHGPGVAPWRASLLWVLFVLGCTLQATVAWGASVEEDDEEPLGGDPGFSIPEIVAAAKRQQAESTGFSLLFGASAYLGSDGNVYRSPNQFGKRSDSRGKWGYLRSDARWGRVNRFLTTATWKQTDYPGHGSVDGNHAHVSNWYTRPLGRGAGVELDLDVSHKSDDAATILGAKYKRDYAYWRYATEGVLTWESGRLHRFRLGAEGVKKNYDETAGLTSVDWTQWMTTLAYRLRLGSSHSLGASYALGERNYREELAGLSTGTELPENPTEHHRYRELTVASSTAISGRLTVDLQYDHVTKKDLFQGYESRATNGAQAGLGFSAARRLEVRLDGRRTWRRYEQITGDGGAVLAYQTQETAVGARYRVVSPVWLFGAIGYYERTTNKGTGSVYRDYHGTVTRMGMSVFL